MQIIHQPVQNLGLPSFPTPCTLCNQCNATAIEVNIGFCRPALRRSDFCILRPLSEMAKIKMVT